MVYRILCVLLLVSTGLCTDAAELRGLVLANELGGPPMDNVEVKAVAGANATVTDDTGLFLFKFPGKQPGEVVQLIVRKAGHIVVNEVQLRQALPKDSDAEILRLLLCKEEVREEMARRFYRLKGNDSIDFTYQQRLKTLEAQHQTNALELAALRNERDQAKAAAANFAEGLARLKPDQTSELHQQAMRLFLDGKVTAAVKILDEDKLGRAVEAARKQRTEAEKALAGAIETYLLRARLLATQFRFDEAAKTYEHASAADPESFAASLAHAVFLHDLNRHKEALSVYERTLSIARRRQSQPEVALTLNKLGNLHSEQNRMEEARKAYEEALGTYRQLARANPDTYRPSVARVLWGMGRMDAATNQHAGARQAFQEALAIFEAFATRDPAQYQPLVDGVKADLAKLPQ